MPEQIIRPVVAADIPAITAIYGHAVLHGTATFELDPPNVTEMTRRFHQITNAGYPYLVAAADSAILGYAYANSYRPRPAYRHTVENSVYLDPTAQRHGIGTKLLNALIEQCGTRGYRQMIAVIGDSENTGSVAVHQRAGFQTIGTHPAVGFKFGRWLDTVMMQRQLGDGARTIP